MELSTQRKTAYFYLLINAFIWGAGLPIVKYAFNEGFEPFRFLLYRFFFASILAVPILVYYWPKIETKFRKIRGIIALELFGLTLSLSILYFGLSKTSSIEAGLISTTTPVFITLGGIWFLHEKEEKNEYRGLLLAFIGTILLTLLPIFVLNDAKFEFSLEGNLIIFGQSLISAAYFVLVRVYYKGIPHFFATAVSFYVGFISFLIINLIDVGSASMLLEHVKTDLSHPSYIFSSFYMAAFGSILALSLLIKGQSLIEISESSLFTYLQPLIAIPISIVWLGEKVLPIQFIALAMIVIGVYTASRRVKKVSS
ncbi:EamA family transporter [Candidatus Dojkabacteria bacterium]|nr:EamA family transporter [Candidatus Dojkabacteria bacterium]